MSRTTIRARGQITLPEDVRRAARLEEGDLLEAEVVEEGILLRRLKVIEAGQEWFWTPEWQAGEREAERQAARGEAEVFTSGEEFLSALRNLAKKPPDKRRRRS